MVSGGRCRVNASEATRRLIPDARRRRRENRGAAASSSLYTVSRVRLSGATLGNPSSGTRTRAVSTCSGARVPYAVPSPISTPPENRRWQLVTPLVIAMLQAPQNQRPPPAQANSRCRSHALRPTSILSAPAAPTRSAPDDDTDGGTHTHTPAQQKVNASERGQGARSPVGHLEMQHACNATRPRSTIPRHAEQYGCQAPTHHSNAAHRGRADRSPPTLPHPQDSENPRDSRDLPQACAHFVRGRRPFTSPSPCRCCSICGPRALGHPTPTTSDDGLWWAAGADGCAFIYMLACGRWPCDVTVLPPSLPRNSAGDVDDASASAPTTGGGASAVRRKLRDHELA